MKRAQNLIFILPILAAATSGCGNILRSNPPQALKSSYELSTGSSGGTADASDSDYACPAQANILPDYDYNHDGSGQYSACFSRTNSADVLLHGILANDTRLCLFPVQVIDAEHIYIKPDLQTGGPWSQCIDATDQGIYASFPGVSYNALFAVAARDKDQMVSCLTGGNYYACPSYSYGRFR